MNGPHNEHTLGLYTIHIKQCGHTLLYDIERSGSLVACGIDMLSADEAAAVKSIAERLFGKGNGVTALRGSERKN